MRLAIMQPYFFPYIGYFQMVNAVDQFVLYDDVQFIQRGWINRNYILSKDGKSLFTIPVKKVKLNTVINEIRIANNSWKDKFLNSIKITYKRAPFYLEGIRIVEKTLDIKSDKISDYAINSIKTVSGYLNLQTNFVESSQIKYNYETDKKQKLNSLISVVGATELILPPGSTEIYEKSDFAVKTSFLIPNNNIHYSQFSKTRFESNLSMIDILMFNTKQEVNNLLKEYTLH